MAKKKPNGKIVYIETGGHLGFFLVAKEKLKNAASAAQYNGSAISDFLETPANIWVKHSWKQKNNGVWLYKQNNLGGGAKVTVFCHHKACFLFLSTDKMRNQHTTGFKTFIIVTHFN